MHRLAVCFITALASSFIFSSRPISDVQAADGAGGAAMKMKDRDVCLGQNIIAVSDSCTVSFFFFIISFSGKSELYG